MATPRPVSRWRRQIGRAPFNSTPVVGADGTIYVTANLAKQGLCYSRLYALDADGRCRWRHSQGWGIIDAPTMAADGTVWIPVNSTYRRGHEGLLGLDPDSGRVLQRWSLPVKEQRPCLHGDLIYCGMRGESRELRFLCAFRTHGPPPSGISFPTYECGTPVWFADLGCILSSPLITPDGMLYICARTDLPDVMAPVFLHAFGPLAPGEPPSGERWRNEIECLQYPAPAAGGGVVLWQPGEAIQAVGVDGAKRWRHVLAEPLPVGPLGYAVVKDRAWREGFRTPAVGVTATYFCTADRRLLAIGAQGTMQWERQLAARPTAGPCALPVGGVLVACADGSLLALDADGQVRWSYQTGAPVRATPTCGAEGMIYLGSDDGMMHALTPEGRVRWRFASDLGMAPHVDPAVGPRGSVYVGTSEGLYALSRTGRRLWTGATPLLPYRAPRVTADGRILATGVDGKLYCFTSDGTPRWTFAGEDCLVTSAVHSEESIIYVGGDQGTIYAVSEEGTLIWRYSTPYQNHPRICADPGQAVYCNVSQYRQLYALNAQGRERWVLELADHLNDDAMATTQQGVLLVRQNTALLALGADGRRVWTFETTFEPEEPSPPPNPALESLIRDRQWQPLVRRPRRDWLEVGPVVAADGAIYLWGRNWFYALEPGGTLRWSSALETAPVYGRAIAVADDGTIVARTSDRLYVLTPAGEILHRRQCRLQRGIAGFALDKDAIYLATTDGYLQRIARRGTGAAVS